MYFLNFKNTVQNMKKITMFSCNYKLIKYIHNCNDKHISYSSVRKYLVLLK